MNFTKYPERISIRHTNTFLYYDRFLAVFNIYQSVHIQSKRDFFHYKTMGNLKGLKAKRWKETSIFMHITVNSFKWCLLNDCH